MAIQIRNTRQKEAIRNAFVHTDRPLSPEEALVTAQAEIEAISIATVYRNINALVEDGWLVRVELPGESTRYEVAGKEHHHHFHCNSCGKLYEVEGCGVPVKPKLPRGFRTTGHELFLYGTCAVCR
jgi:Fur family ferric uptake transcriptional regulator